MINQVYPTLHPAKTSVAKWRPSAIRDKPIKKIRINIAQYVINIHLLFFSHFEIKYASVKKKSTLICACPEGKLNDVSCSSISGRGREKIRFNSWFKPFPIPTASRTKNTPR